MIQVSESTFILTTRIWEQIAMAQNVLLPLTAPSLRKVSSHWSHPVCEYPTWYCVGHKHDAMYLEIQKWNTSRCEWQGAERLTGVWWMIMCLEPHGWTKKPVRPVLQSWGAARSGQKSRVKAVHWNLKEKVKEFEDRLLKSFQWIWNMRTSKLVWFLCNETLRWVGDDTNAFGYLCPWRAGGVRLWNSSDGIHQILFLASQLSPAPTRSTEAVCWARGQKAGL